MNLHEILKEYTHNEKYYTAEGYATLLNHLLSYSTAHPWFHYYGTMVPDSDENHYFHYVVLYWTEGQRPTINTFNFIKLPDFLKKNPALGQN